MTISANLNRPSFLSKSSTPIWVVITGSVRSGDEFRRMFHQAEELRNKGLADGILYSTWRYELESVPGLESALEAAGVTVIQLEPPSPGPNVNPLLHGHVYHQRKSLRFALDALPPRCYVLKARTDLAEQRFEAMIQAIFGENRESIAVGIKNPVLSTRLFTFDARTDYFFYWDDIVFSGTREDLIKLNNLDISPEILYPANFFPPECRLFAPAFLSQYPILRWFFENVDAEMFALLIGRWATDRGDEPLPELVLRTLASYLHILSRYVVLANPSVNVDREITLESFFSPDDTLGVSSFPKPWTSHKLHSTGLLEILRQPDRKIAGSPLHRVSEMIELMDDDPALRGDIPENFGELIDSFEAFSKSKGISVYKPQYDRSALDRARVTADFSKLDNIELPEKRYPSRTQLKILGLRKKLAKFVFDKIL